MPPVQQHAATTLQQHISNYFADPKQVLREAAQHLSSLIAADALLDEDTHVAMLAQLAHDIRDEVRADVFGAGFIGKRVPDSAAEEVFCWWQGADFHRLQFVLETANKNRIDYTSLEWFKVPAETGEPHVCGPFVDFLCNDEYTVTVSSPVQVGGQFVGVVALDILMETIERDLMPVLESFAGQSVVVNSRGRILLANGGDCETGDVYVANLQASSVPVLVAEAA